MRLVHGECVSAMQALVDASVDAVVTDPPYGLSFMGKRWDYAIPGVDVFAEMFRVLVPGGRLLCFAGSRTMHRMWCNIEDAGFTIEDSIMWLYGSGFPKHRSKLKPAFEPICVARKGGVSELNIDACRIGTDTIVTHGGHRASTENYRMAHKVEAEHIGRWPANIVLDEEAARLLDEQSGTLTSGARRGPNERAHSVFGLHGGPCIGDSGGASRFFYCAKADRSERDAGLEGTEMRAGGSNSKGFTEDVANGQDRNRPVANHHPTVKPVDLMRWLCRLVTPPGGTVLDPFMGSGTTGVAATLEGFGFIGIEREAEYVDIARARITSAPLSLFGAA